MSDVAAEEYDHLKERQVGNSDWCHDQSIGSESWWEVLDCFGLRIAKLLNHDLRMSLHLVLFGVSAVSCYEILMSWSPLLGRLRLSKTQALRMASHFDMLLVRVLSLGSPL